MGRFLIEVPHEDSKAACSKAVLIFHQSGSHFLTHAEWGCKDGVHSAWLEIEVENKEQARQILPPAYRSKARIVELNTWSGKELDALAQIHQDSITG